MQRAQWINAIHLVYELMQEPDTGATVSELCRMMGLKRSPYALEIINFLEREMVIHPVPPRIINGLQAKQYAVFSDTIGDARLFIDEAWDAIRAYDEETDDELPF